jgi:hypothetical protein
MSRALITYHRDMSNPASLPKMDKIMDSIDNALYHCITSIGLDIARHTRVNHREYRVYGNGDYYTVERIG